MERDVRQSDVVANFGDLMANVERTKARSGEYAALTLALCAKFFQHAIGGVVERNLSPLPALAVDCDRSFFRIVGKVDILPEKIFRKLSQSHPGMERDNEDGLVFLQRPCKRGQNYLFVFYFDNENSPAV